jgi:hypothetical protein
MNRVIFWGAVIGVPAVIILSIIAFLMIGIGGLLSNVGSLTSVVIITMIGIAVYDVVKNGGKYAWMITLVLGVTLITMFCLILYYGPGWQDEVNKFQYANREDKPATSQTSPDAVGPRIVAENFTIPANGSVTIERLRRCSTPNLTDEELVLVQQDTSHEGLITFNSKSAKPISARIWFHDEGGECKEEAIRLAAEQAFK